MKPIDTTQLVATVERAKGVMASAKAQIIGQGAITAEAVRVALEAQGVTDDNFVAIAVAAVNDSTTAIAASADDLATALVANPTQ